MSKKAKDSKEELVNEKDTESGETSANETAQLSENEKESEGDSAKLEKEIQELRDKYLRLAAEFDNYRKRTSREILEIRQTASKDLIVALLEVLDDIDRADSQIKESGDNGELLKGIELIFNKFRRILDQRGLKQIETMHTEFDVEKDEAISETPVEDERLKGKVVAEVQKGYTLNGKLIRFAKVVVGR